VNVSDITIHSINQQLRYYEENIVRIACIINGASDFNAGSKSGLA
jgi:hypothetical protein